MIVAHELPAGWVDTGEAGKIQPSEVAGLVHVVTIEPGDLLQGEPGPAGADGADGADGAPGPQGIQGPQGPAGVAPAGAVLFFAMAAAPAGWLVCDGSLKSRADYAALFAAIGTLYGAGDGATTFKLPDLRGEFIRGSDGGRGIDPGRVLGSAQNATSIADYVHSDSGTAGSVGGLTVFKGDLEGPVVAYNQANATYHASAAAVSNGGAPYSYGQRVRPRNIALLPCISTGA